MALAVRATCRLYSWFVGVRRGELFGVEWSWCARVDVSIQLAVVSVARVDVPIRPARVIFLFLLLSLFCDVVVGHCYFVVPILGLPSF